MDYRYLLDHPELEAVSIVTPAHQHLVPTVDAIRAGKHILVEKPLAVRLEEAQRIVDAAENHSACLMVAHLLRFEVNYATVYAALAEGNMGSPVAVIARFNNPIHEARRSAGQISVILHLAIHLIDLCLWCMGSIPEQVSCRGPKDSANHKYAEPEKQERMLGLSSIS